MKPLRLIIASILAGSLLTGCVSMNKYQASVSARQQLTSEKEDLERKVDKLNKDLALEKATSSKELEQQQAALAQKERELADREKKAQELNEMVNAQKQAIENLRQEVCSALKCFTPDELTIEIRDGRLYVSLSDKLLFPSGSDVVNKRGQEAIEMLSVVLANSDLEIMVEGHTDSVPINSGRNKDNWDLSAHRATSVTRIMTDNGIAPERIIASGRSEFHPLASNETSDGRQSNRRTEIVLAPKLDKLWELTETENVSLGKR